MLLACIVVIASPVRAQESNARDVRVLHSESLTLEWSDDADTTRKHSAAVSSSRSLRFDAYGRRFDLALSENDKWPQLSKSRGATARAYRGQLKQRSDSWVRLTQVGTATHGMIWDGEQLYAIAPASDVSDTNASGTVIFRLADTATDSTEFCSAHASAESDQASGAALYSAMQSDAQKSTSAAAALGDGSLQLKLSILIDAAFRAQYASDAAAVDAVIVRLNNVDGMFSSQFDADVEVASIQLADASMPVSDSLEADVLLRSVAARRAANAQLANTGITHLFTGRDLKGTVVGLAYIDQVCDGAYGAALSEVRSRGAWFDSLVVAHELGHSFGAPHDGEGECVDAPKTYLMSPYINGSDRFSNCSNYVMQRRLQAASCLTPTITADMSIAPSLDTHRHAADADFEQTIVVTNRGGTASHSVVVDVTIPPALSIVNAGFNGGLGAACTQGAGVVSCSAASIAANGNAAITLSMRGSQLGTYSIQASVSALSDADLLNNTSSGSIIIEAPTAVAVTAPAAPTPVSSTASEPATGESSGGGSTGVQLLALLWLALALRTINLRTGRH
jgi:hypothetical protein